MIEMLNRFNDMKISEKMIIVLLVVLPWTLIFQGLNHIDEWFIVTNFYYFLSHPESINYGFTHYLTDLIGHVFGVLFSSAWLIGYRIGWIVEMYLIFIISYVLLRDFLARPYILRGLLLAFLFTNSIDVIDWIHYSYTTVLFYVLALYFLWRGLSRGSPVQLLFSGLVFGINVFVRLPNFVFIALWTLIPIYYFFFNISTDSYKENFKKSLIWSLVFVAWFTIGLGGILYLSYELGHYNLLLEAIRMILGMAQEWAETKNHGLSYLFALYAKEWALSLIISSAVIFGLFVTQKVSFIRRRGEMLYPSIGLWLLLGAISAMKFQFSYQILGLEFFTNYITFLFPPIFLTGATFFILKRHRADRALSFAFLLGVTCLLTVQLWSGGYVEMMQNAGFLCFPLLMFFVDTETESIISRYIKACLIAIAIASIISAGYMIYRNNSYFIIKNHVSGYKLWLLWVSAESQQEFDDIWNFLYRRKTSEKLLYLSNFWPGSYFYYLYDRMPYIGNSVPAYYPVSDFQSKLSSELRTWVLPLLIIYKYENIPATNPYRKHWESVANEAFKILSKNNVLSELVLETKNFQFYATATRENRVSN